MKKPSFNRDRPDLPAELTPSAGPPGIDGDTLAIHELRLQDLESAGLKLASLRIQDSVLERVRFAEGQFGSVQWRDVRLVGCDFANVRAQRMVLVRVELIDCRMTGFSAAALDWQDVLIQNADLRYAQCQRGKFRSCEFDACNCQEADLQGADLTGAILRSCRLSGADVRGARLQNADLRRSEVDGMVAGVGDLQGAIVDPAQAMVFARLLGLQIL